MKIYVGHSTDLEYEEKLYQPLKESSLAEKHELVFPHNSEEFFNSKKFIREDCDLFIAEVSKGSTGLGIELGWAEEFGVPVFCVYKDGSEPSEALKAVSNNIFEYKDLENMVEIIKEFIEGK